jgi:hypothetical protein
MRIRSGCHWRTLCDVGLLYSRLMAARHLASRLAILAISILAIGCAGWRPQEPSLDGWPLGAESSCDPAIAGDPRYDVVGIASTQLASPRTDVTTTACFAEGTYLNGSQLTVVTRSGGVTVVVFSFRDGSRRAAGVFCEAGCAYVRPPDGPQG